MVVVGSIVLINSALYLTSNFIIYFFKYDLGGAGWKATYTLFSTVGGAAQILGMMVLLPLAAQKFSSTQVFHLSLVLALCGYGTLLVFCLTGLSHSLAMLCIPGVVVFACNGMLTVLTTLFLSNSVDYGQLKTGRREESVIFSMQTFVVKAASGVAVFLTGIGLDLIGLVGNTEETGPVGSTKRRNPAGSALDDDRSAHAGAGWCAGAVPPQICSDRCPRCRDQRTAPRGGSAP